MDNRMDNRMDRKEKRILSEWLEFRANLSSFRGIHQIRLRSDEQKKMDKKYLFGSRNKFCYFGREKGKSMSVTVCLTIDDTSDVKISFYFENKIDTFINNNNRRRKSNFKSSNWFPFHEHDVALFQLKAEGILLLFPPKA